MSAYRCCTLMHGEEVFEMGSRRGFGAVRRLPSKRYQASYVGPDQVRRTAPTTFATKGDAEAWLANRRADPCCSCTPCHGRARHREHGQWLPGEDLGDGLCPYSGSF